MILFPSDNSGLRSMSTIQDGDPTRERWVKYLCLLLFSLVLAERVAELLLLSFHYTDVDHVVMWHAAHDFASVHFYEPCFYGQSYNTMIESLVAAPFVKMGLAVEYVLPVVSHLFALLPFVWLFIVAYRRKQYTTASLMMGLLLLLPAEFGMLSSLRGFIPGVLVASFGFIALLRPSKTSFALFGFCAVLGYVFNPNSVLISAPLALYLFTVHYREKWFYICGLAGSIPAFTFYFFSQDFYIDHPEYNLHKPWPLEFDTNTLSAAKPYLDEFFDKISPVFLMDGKLLIPAFVVLGFGLLFFRRWRESLAVLACGAIIVFSLGFQKVHNGDYSLFFSTSRMFLAVPYFFVMLLALIPVRNSIRITAAAALLGTAFFSFKMYTLDEKIEYYTTKEINQVVEVRSIAEVRMAAQQLADMSRQHNAEAIIILEDDTDKYKLCAYAGPVLQDLPPTLFPSYERRTWLLKEMSGKIYSVILFAGGHENEWKARIDSSSNIAELNSDVYILENNKLPLIEVLRNLKISVRPF
jgi:hypothetical protein